MADFIISGQTFSGSPTNTANPQRPLTVDRTIIKVGKMLVAANGTTTWAHRGFKRKWAIGWGDKANSVTAGVVLAIYALTTTFNLTDVDGTSYTCVTVGDDEYTEGITTDRANAYKFNITLVAREV